MRAVPRRLLPVLALLAAAGAPAAPIAYTVYLVTDGQIGNWVFTDALVRITLASDTRNVQNVGTSQQPVYVNSHGAATVTVSRNTHSVTARINPGQIYARYDVAGAQVGFASANGTDYPVALTCDCDMTQLVPGLLLDDDILFAQADLIRYPADNVYYSPGVNAQVTDLTRPAVLDGWAIACVNYLADGTCGSPPAIPLLTDHGQFILEDQQHGRGLFSIVRLPQSE